MGTFCLRFFATVFFLTLAHPGIGGAASVGEEWEYQGTAEMMGMKMPVGPAKHCQRGNEPSTPPMEGNCTFSNVTKQGTTTKFDFACAPPDEITGSGIAILKDGQIITKYAMKSDGRDGTVTLVGKKIGKCKF